MAMNPLIESLCAVVDANKGRLANNYERLDIFSGNLLHYVDRALCAQLSEGAYKQAKHRIAPINVLTKIIQKLSKIYASGVSREIVPSKADAPVKDTDQALFAWYQSVLKPTQRMQLSNSYFNLFGNSLIVPVKDAIDVAPRMRIIPSDRFVPFNFGGAPEDEAEGVCIYIKKGKALGKKSGEVSIYQVMTADYYGYFDTAGENRTAEMLGAAAFTAEFDGNGFATHDIGRRPFVYVNRDPNRLVPTEDSDILAMTKLLPILLTDINFAHMFQAFAIIYGINIVDKGLSFAPNAVWTFDTPPGAGPERKPEIGTITPNADIAGGLSLIANQFAMWLNTKGIKPGAIGEISASNFSSGISKILDEMDTSENRVEQVPFYEDAEKDLWDLILKSLHPIWSKQPGFGGPKGLEFSPDARVMCHFSEQVPLVRRGAVVADAKAEVDAGFSTNKRALRRINPSYTESEIIELQGDIAAEREANNAAGEKTMNGAQVASLVDVLVKVGLGVLTPAAAIATMQAAFGLTEETASNLVKSIPPGSVKPEQVA
jgi:hypothetical protein